METKWVLVSLLVGVHTATAGFSAFSSALDKCSGDPDPSSCLKVKAVNLLDRALSTDALPISDFMTITKDPRAKEDFTTGDQTKGDLEANLPRDLAQRSSTLDKMVLDRITKYLETRTIQLNLPTDVFEGRDKGFKGYKKGKGGGLYVLMFGAFGALLLQLATTALALIAGKALLIGKVALLLAGVLGLKSLLTHSHEEKHHPQVIYAEPEIHHPSWSRSTQIPEAAHDIAYRGQRST